MFDSSMLCTFPIKEIIDAMVESIKDDMDPLVPLFKSTRWGIFTGMINFAESNHKVQNPNKYLGMDINLLRANMSVLDGSSPCNFSDKVKNPFICKLDPFEEHMALHFAERNILDKKIWQPNDRNEANDDAQLTILERIRDELGTVAVMVTNDGDLSAKCRAKGIFVLNKIAMINLSTPYTLRWDETVRLASGAEYVETKTERYGQRAIMEKMMGEIFREWRSKNTEELREKRKRKAAIDNGDDVDMCSRKRAKRSS
jgi:hypothetical protein